MLFATLFSLSMTAQHSHCRSPRQPRARRQPIYHRRSSQAMFTDARLWQDDVDEPLALISYRRGDIGMNDYKRFARYDFFSERADCRELPTLMLPGSSSET
jgi:hypothetical protein